MAQYQWVSTSECARKGLFWQGQWHSWHSGAGRGSRTRRRWLCAWAGRGRLPKSGLNDVAGIGNRTAVPRRELNRQSPIEKGVFDGAKGPLYRAAPMMIRASSIYPGQDEFVVSMPLLLLISPIVSGALLLLIMSEIVFWPCGTQGTPSKYKTSSEAWRHNATWWNKPSPLILGVVHCTTGPSVPVVDHWNIHTVLLAAVPSTKDAFVAELGRFPNSPANPDMLAVCMTHASNVKSLAPSAKVADEGV